MVISVNGEPPGQSILGSESGMAPALTKILNDGHGIHLSSPPASVRMDTDGRAVCSADLDSQLISTEDSDLQKMWLNLSMIPSLDSCLPMSPLDVPANPVLSPCLQVSSSQAETLLFPSPAHLLSLLSSNKALRDSQQVASVFPGVPDMFLVPLPEHNSQEASLLQGCNAVTDGGDVHHSPLTLPHSYSHGEIKHQGYSPFFTAQPSLTEEKEAGIGFLPPSSEQPCWIRISSDQAAFRVVPDEAVKEQVCRQAGLCSRAQRLQTRLQALLGEHAVLHCDQQLEGLTRYCQVGGVSQESVNPGLLPPQVDFEPQFSWQESSTPLCSFEELREFTRCSQEVLRGLQEALDSEATASSSSDEEQEERKRHSRTRTLPVSSSSGSGGSGSSERQWLEERAELGGRWSWLQLRLAELEGRIEQLVGLHKHIRSTKGGVVLADAQPMTDRQIQHSLLREMAGLSCTASDADAEPCSPTRLLHNIERQSAQLSQIVNSLMPPLSFSPLSKQPNSWRVKGSLTSGQKGDVFMNGKRRRLGTRRLFKADMSCVCARTRPLVTYHKPRLFPFKTCSLRRSQDSGTSTSTLSSPLSSSTCSCCSSCDPVVLCSDPDCSSSRAQTSRIPNSTPNPVLSSSFDTPLSLHLKGARAREEWSLMPLVINIQASSPAHCKRRSSTPLHNSRRNKQHTRHHKSRVMGLSPIRRAGSNVDQHRRTNQRKRKRRRIQRLIEDEEDVLYQLCDPEDSSDDIQEESYSQVSHKQISQGCIRKRQGESVYNINNIVIPMSLSKVEKLQYKDILTPSWRVVDPSSLPNREEEKDGEIEEVDAEDLTDEVFVKRHLGLEQREKMRWSSWGKRKCCRRPNRSGSRLSSSGGGMCTSGEESSVELCCAQLDTDEQQSLEERLQPQTPWEPRLFPLCDDEEEALLPSEWSQCSSGSPTSKNSIAHLSPAQSSGAKLPSSGQSNGSTHNSS
ncbi:KAT8 regulatory NSL complex subunit 1-like protein isoform X1 [Labrus mixtus]|uniref:KAT8 regulatory NSL complex subunit 1-like protein isoform X1 n=1 Tax=Labrus mixtus TaxID=508554 RepID=UPI0029BFFA9D|nr:KAT8 regulatory NSL complex subunit 1-like protein isoform X1 [Labrus mixtus]